MTRKHQNLMNSLILTPALTRELKRAIDPHMTDVNETIDTTYQALQEISLIGETMYRGLDRQRRVLKQASRRLNRKDKVVLNSVFKEVDEACHAIDQALHHFNRRVGKVLKNQESYIVVKSKQYGKNKQYNRYRHASSNLRIKMVLRKYKESSSRVKKATIKISVPRFLRNMLSGIGLSDNEKRLREITNKYNSISGEIADSKIEVNGLMDEILSLLQDLNDKSYPDKLKRISEVQKLKKQMIGSFDKQDEHILKFKQNFQHHVATTQERIQRAVDKASEIVGEAGKPLPKEMLQNFILQVQKA